MVVAHLVLTMALSKPRQSRIMSPLRPGEAPQRAPAQRRTAHKAEESYKQRYLPDQGWVQVTPTRIFRVTLWRESQQCRQETDVAEEESIVLAASMRRDDSAAEESFTVQVGKRESTAEVETKIWRLHRIGDAEVAIELQDANGDALPEETAVLDSLALPSCSVMLSFLQWSGEDQIVLTASTLGGTFQVYMEACESMEALSAKIRRHLGLDASTTLRLSGPDGLALCMDMTMRSFALLS